MLEGLDKVDWSKLEHAYGEASDVPDLLRQLLSADKDERENAIYELYGNIWHQGTVCGATAPAVPFLIELIEANGVSGKAEILVLLSHLANGSSFHDVHQHLPLLKDKAGTAEWQERIPRELAWVRNANAAVKAGESIYLKLLSSPEPEVREAAVYLLASLDEPAPRLAIRLWEKLDQETDERTRASLLLGFGCLAEKVDSSRSLLLHAMSTESARSLKLAAALSFTRMAPDRIPRETVEMFLEALRDPRAFNSLEDSPWVREDGLDRLITKHLAGLDGEAAVSIEQTLAQILPGEKHPQALVVAEALLTIAFRKPLPAEATFTSLTEQQQRILRLIATNRQVWVQTVGGEPAVSVRTSLLVRACGLPDKLNEFLAFVANEASVFPDSPPEKR